MLRRTFAEINLGNIAHNIGELKRCCGTEVMAVIKADAYGHGVCRVAERALMSGVTWAAVATPDEAMELRKAFSDMHILILSPVEDDTVATLAEHDISMTLCSAEQARVMGELKGAVKAHVKVDTGMGRVGLVTDDEFRKLIDVLKASPNIQAEGIFTHFATADEADKTFTKKQLNRFLQVCGMFEKAGFHPLRHAANSAAIIDVKEACIDLCRMGISLYGYMPSDTMLNYNVDLRPVMSLKSYVSFVKTIHKGDSVSYGRTYIAGGDRRIATIPVGYADGYRRELSGKGRVYIDGVGVPVAGRVCMDQIMVDVTGLEVSVGDEAVLMDERFSADDMARIAGTISYEILTGITKRVPRVYVG